eukprot:TRINITY_DN2246_c0_g1_i3.p1 TRINITY_DN2246_c0_g1~~TRINITY_DN2246_c0_g1_i3.p1  ORF type:complete len:343 (+),score=63.76 TRINITY_DN2246_c0_g1_i3:186-1214(+)
MEVVHQELEDEERHVMEPEGEEDDYGEEENGDEEREADEREMGDDLQEEEEVEGLDLYDDVDLGYGMTPPVLEPIPGQIRSQPAMETEAVEDEQEERQMAEADDEPVEGLGLDLYEDVDLGEDYGIPPQVPVPVVARTESGAKASNGRLANDADGTAHRAEPMSDTNKAASRAFGQEVSPSHVAQASKHGRGDSGAGGGTIGGPGVQIVGSGTTAGVHDICSGLLEYGAGGLWHDTLPELESKYREVVLRRVCWELVLQGGLSYHVCARLVNDGTTCLSVAFYRVLGFVTFHSLSMFASICSGHLMLVISNHARPSLKGCLEHQPIVKAWRSHEPGWQWQLL